MPDTTVETTLKLTYKKKKEKEKAKLGTPKRVELTSIWASTSFRELTP